MNIKTNDERNTYIDVFLKLLLGSWLKLVSNPPHNSNPIYHNSKIMKLKESSLLCFLLFFLGGVVLLLFILRFLKFNLITN